jgi:hypothetical protein
LEITIKFCLHFDYSYYSLTSVKLEEGMGFEPMERFHVRRFSKPVL